MPLVMENLGGGALEKVLTMDNAVNVISSIVFKEKNNWKAFWKKHGMNSDPNPRHFNVKRLLANPD
jgi:hypothetical protein